MHGFGFQIDLKLTKFNGSSFFVKSQSAVLNFCHLTSFFISIYCKMRKIFFCQIIMGSPLNDNVSKGRSVVSNKLEPASKLPFLLARSLVSSSEGASCLFTLQFDKLN